MKTTGIFYGSTTGNTEDAANGINIKLGGSAKLHNVDTATALDLEKYEVILLGSSTWGLGDLQDDWEAFMSELERADLNGKKVALFGLGDADSYSSTFVDAMGSIYSSIQGKGCEIIGMVAIDQYQFDASTAVVDGKFVGLPLDMDNERERTDDRITKWVESLKEHLQ